MLERKFYVKEILLESTFSNNFYIRLYTFEMLILFLRDKFVLAILIRISEWEL